MQVQNKILQGDALTKLKELQEKSINMVMTSPPYWALRDYGVDVETIWGGDEDCEHEWGNEIEGKSLRGTDDTPRKEVIEKTKLSGSSFCQKCGSWKGQLGLEPTFDKYINNLCDIFDEVKRVLRDDGTCWVNLGDTYNDGRSGGHVGGKIVFGKIENNLEAYPKQSRVNVEGMSAKCLTMIPSRFAIEMVNRGWILRNTIIWHKPNCMPSSIKDRFTVDFEYIFFFSKKKSYYFETQYEKSITGKSEKFNSRVRDVKRGYIKSGQYKASCREIEQYHGGNIITQINRNKRTVWSICPKPFKEAHFAVYPEELCETPIKAGCPEGGIVLDPFFGAGTTGLVALKQNKNFLGIELNLGYIEIANKRLKPFLEQTTLNLKSKSVHKANKEEEN